MKRLLSLLLVPLVLSACGAPGEGAAGAAAAGEAAPESAERAPGVPYATFPQVETPGRPGQADHAKPPVAVTCPPSGAELWFGETNAAMGLRAVSLFIANCGDTTIHLDGYPEVRPLDEDKNPVAVRITHRTAEISASLEHFDVSPRRIGLRPGDEAAAPFAWRNTYDDITNPPVTVPLIEVGQPAQRVILDAPFDLGSTGRLGVGPWQPVEPVPRPTQTGGGTISEPPELPLL
ncbi:DUF4232 domain-containing protein [Actinoplanes missouriensis]|uniref:DUF4232 domain-containing protein n=1 Tax=Actinoplanes missouriensis TaxID=1866 RepID=UPI0033FFA655